jgi:hypothetical protein
LEVSDYTLGADAKLCSLYPADLQNPNPARLFSKQKTKKTKKKVELEKFSSSSSLQCPPHVHIDCLVVTEV